MVTAAQSACEAQEVLFEELHHRFLNSLQVIAAMARGLGREEATVASRRANIASLEDRISAMGEFHRRLALGSSGNLADDCRQIWRCLTTTFGRADASLVLEVLDSELDLATARVVMTLLAELMTNALKHADPARPLVVRASIVTWTETVEVRITSTGCGGVRFGPATAPRVISRLVTMLGGRLTVCAETDYAVEIVWSRISEPVL